MQEAAPFGQRCGPRPLRVLPAALLRVDAGLARPTETRAPPAHAPRARAPHPPRREVPPRAPSPRGPRCAVPGARDPRVPSTSPPQLPAAAASLPGPYPGAVVAHHHLPALAVHGPPWEEPLPSHNLQPPPPPPGPGSFLLLLLGGPSFNPIFFPYPEVTAQPRPSFSRRPGRKRRDRM